MSGGAGKQLGDGSCQHRGDGARRRQQRLLLALDGRKSARLRLTLKRAGPGESASSTSRRQRQPFARRLNRTRFRPSTGSPCTYRRCSIASKARVGQREGNFLRNALGRGEVMVPSSTTQGFAFAHQLVAAFSRVPETCRARATIQNSVSVRRYSGVPRHADAEALQGPAAARRASSRSLRGPAAARQASARPGTAPPMRASRCGRLTFPWSDSRRRPGAQARDDVKSRCRAAGEEDDRPRARAGPGAQLAAQA